MTVILDRRYPSEFHLSGALKSVTVVAIWLPEKMAYDIVKAVFTHLDQLHRAIKPAKATTVENTAKFIGKTTIPFHPGAIKYFKEIGAIK